MVASLAVFENLFCVVLLSINHPVKLIKEPRIKLCKKLNKSVLSHVTFYLEDDDHKAVSCSGEPTSFTCQLIKILKKINLSMIRPKKETKDFLLSITKNCDTLITKNPHTSRKNISF